MKVRLKGKKRRSVSANYNEANKQGNIWSKSYLDLNIFYISSSTALYQES